MSHLIDNKIPQRGVLKVYRGKICKCWTPLHKFGNNVPRNFKFGTQIDLGMSHLMDDKLHHRGCGGVYLCTKLDVSSFTRYKIREGVQKFKNSTQDPHNTPF